MGVERYVEILERLSRRERSDQGLTTLCSLTKEITGLDGAAVGLLSSGNTVSEFCASDPEAHRLLALEDSVGEGPCLTASTSGEVICEGWLNSNESPLWQFYSPEAWSEGARAVFAFPVLIGAARIGALVLYRRDEGELEESKFADAHLMASIIARAVLALQAGAQRGTLSKDLERAATFDFAIQQAAGMVAVQANVTLLDALVLIRSHGFALSITSNTLANQIVAREIRYEPDGKTWLRSE